MDSTHKIVIPPLSIEFRQIEKRLRNTEVGAVVTWDELLALTQRSLPTIQALVRRVRDRLLKEDRMHFETRAGEGVERIDEREVVHSTLPKQRQQVIGRARKLGRTATHLNLSNLNTSERSTALGHQAAAHFVAQTLATKQMKALSADLTKANAISPPTPRELYERMLATKS